VPRQPIAVSLEPEQRQQLDGACRQVSLLGPEGRAREKGRDERPRSVALETCLDVVDHGKVAEQPDVLERAGDPEPGDPVRRRPGDVATVEPDRAGRRPEEPGQDMEQRRLARAVRSDDAMDGSGAEPQVVVAQRLESTE
jgi:hypothetical protein